MTDRLAAARFGDGLAVDADLVHAAEQATYDALAPLAGAAPDRVCVGVSGGDPDEVAAAAERTTQLAGAGALVGCSAAGVIGGGRGVEARPAVSVWAGVLPGVRLRTFHLETLPADAGAAVVGLPERDDDEVAVLLADPWSFPAEGFVSSVNAALEGLRIVGGLAGGMGGSGSTRLFVDGRVVERGAVGVLVGGGSGARTLVSQGCRPVGPPMTVTAAVGNVLRGLAGTTALSKVEDVIAGLPPVEQALASAGLHLGIALDEYADEHEHGDFLVRGIFGAEPETDGVVVGDLVPVGATVRLHVRDAEAADAELRALLERSRNDDTAGVGGALLFSCNGRGAGLFGPGMGGADHDPGAVRAALAPAGVAGFFASGEIGPVGGRNHLHGFTASLLTFPA